mmetsp:Transcript_8030/g.20683  ORF Transcript_8030/g.20683 Transcript_8030/m.20683 type:complete len:355 (+) Transcript_8030:541-1605(+)
MPALGGRRALGRPHAAQLALVHRGLPPQVGLDGHRRHGHAGLEPRVRRLLVRPPHHLLPGLRPPSGALRPHHARLRRRLPGRVGHPRLLPHSRAVGDVGGGHRVGVVGRRGALRRLLRPPRRRPLDCWGLHLGHGALHALGVGEPLHMDPQRARGLLLDAQPPVGWQRRGGEERERARALLRALYDGWADAPRRCLPLPDHVAGPLRHQPADPQPPRRRPRRRGARVGVHADGMRPQQRRHGRGPHARRQDRRRRGERDRGRPRSGHGVLDDAAGAAQHAAPQDAFGPGLRHCAPRGEEERRAQCLVRGAGALHDLLHGGPVLPRLGPAPLIWAARASPRIGRCGSGHRGRCSS